MRAVPIKGLMYTLRINLLFFVDAILQHFFAYLRLIVSVLRSNVLVNVHDGFKFHWRENYFYHICGILPIG